MYLSQCNMGKAPPMSGNISTNRAKQHMAIVRSPYLTSPTFEVADRPPRDFSCSMEHWNNKTTLGRMMS